MAHVKLDEVTLDGTFVVIGDGRAESLAMIIMIAERGKSEGHENPFEGSNPFVGFASAEEAGVMACTLEQRAEEMVAAAVASHADLVA